MSSQQFSPPFLRSSHNESSFYGFTTQQEEGQQGFSQTDPFTPLRPGPKPFPPMDGKAVYGRRGQVQAQSEEGCRISIVIVRRKGPASSRQQRTGETPGSLLPPVPASRRGEPRPSRLLHQEALRLRQEGIVLDLSGHSCTSCGFFMYQWKCCVVYCGAVL